MIRRKNLLKIAKTVLKLASDYKGAPHREMSLDGLLYGFLYQKYKVKRQHNLISNSKRPKRIDFREGGPNPTLIEFVVRTQTHKVEAYGTQNKSELYKLARQNKTKARYLLILDMAKAPISRQKLEATYRDVSHQKGRGARRSVRVVYVHKGESYHFLWQRKRRAA